MAASLIKNMSSSLVHLHYHITALPVSRLASQHQQPLFIDYSFSWLGHQKALSNFLLIRSYTVQPEILHAWNLTVIISSLQYMSRKF